MPSGLQLYQKRLQHRCFPVKFAKLLRTPILKNICEQFLMTCINMQAMFRKFSKGPEQNLSLFSRIPYIIAVLENPSKDDLSDSKGNDNRRIPLQ